MRTATLSRWIWRICRVSGGGVDSPSPPCGNVLRNSENVNMNRKRENGMLVLAVLMWAAVTVLAVICCSCSGRKVVTDTVYVHDTLRVSHTDTVSIERWNWRHDTLRIETEKVVTLLQPGKSAPAETIRVETNNWHYQHEIVRDSASKVVTRVDSILRALDKQREKTTVKRTPLINPMDAFLIFLIICGIGCVCILVNKK